MKWFSHLRTRQRRVYILGLILWMAFASAAQAADPPTKPQSSPTASRETVEERTATLQRQVASLAEQVVAQLGAETLGPQDVKAIVEVLALQRAVEVFANLVASYNKGSQQHILIQNIPMVEEYLKRAEEALAEAPNVGKKEVPKPPSAAHPVSIRSTLDDVRTALGLSRQPVISKPESPEQEEDLVYFGPEPTDDEMQVAQFNLERLRAAAERMGRGKCYREFWTRNCADALEYHALPHQKRSFAKLLVTTRDLLRKYCESPRLAQLRKQYELLIRHLSVRPIVYDYGGRTTPFVDHPDLVKLQCSKRG